MGDLQQSPHSITRLCTCRCLDSRYWQCLQVVSLLFVLFGPDIVALKSAPDSINSIIDGLLLASMALFTLDVLLSVVCRQKVIWLEVPLPSRLPYVERMHCLSAWILMCAPRLWNCIGEGGLESDTAGLRQPLVSQQISESGLLPVTETAMLAGEQYM